MSDQPKIPLPAVEILSDASAVTRRYLVLEIRGGDERTAQSWYGIAELEFETLVLMLKSLLPESPMRARRNPPQVLLHKPTEVQA